MAVLGKNGDFVFNGSDFSGDGNQLGMSFAIEAIEVTTFGISWKKFIEGMIEATLTYSAFFNGAVQLTGTPTAPTAAAASGGAVSTGTHTWKVTYGNGYGETLAGTASNQLTIAGGTQTVNLTAVPTGPAGTTKRGIYRTKTGDTGSYFLVGYINDNTTTTFQDILADAALGGTSGTLIAPTVNTSGGNDFLLFNVIGAQTTGLAFAYYPEQNVTGKVKYSGSAIMRRYQLDTRPNAVVTLAAEFVVTDVVTRAIVV